MLYILPLENQSNFTSSPSFSIWSPQWLNSALSEAPLRWIGGSQSEVCCKWHPTMPPQSSVPLCTLIKLLLHMYRASLWLWPLLEFAHTKVRSASLQRPVENELYWSINQSMTVESGSLISLLAWSGTALTGSKFSVGFLWQSLLSQGEAV